MAGYNPRLFNADSLKQSTELKPVLHPTNAPTSNNVVNLFSTDVLLQKSKVAKDAEKQEKTNAERFNTSIAALVNQSQSAVKQGLFSVPKSTPTKKMVPKQVWDGKKFILVFVPEENNTPGLRG